MSLIPISLHKKKRRGRLAAMLYKRSAAFYCNKKFECSIDVSFWISHSFISLFLFSKNGPNLASFCLFIVEPGAAGWTVQTNPLFFFAIQLLSERVLVYLGRKQSFQQLWPYTSALEPKTCMALALVDALQNWVRVESMKN